MCAKCDRGDAVAYEHIIVDFSLTVPPTLTQPSRLLTITGVT